VALSTRYRPRHHPLAGLPRRGAGRKGGLSHGVPAGWTPRELDEAERREELKVEAGRRWVVMQKRPTRSSASRTGWKNRTMEQTKDQTSYKSQKNEESVPDSSGSARRTSPAISWGNEWTERPMRLPRLRHVHTLWRSRSWAWP